MIETVWYLLLGISVFGGIFFALTVSHKQRNPARLEFLEQGIRVPGEIVEYDLMFGCAPAGIRFKFQKIDSDEWVEAYSPLNGFPFFGPEYFPVGMKLEVSYLSKFPKIAVPLPLIKWCVGSGSPSDREFRKAVRLLEKKDLNA
jgi:hypothetical protein